MKNIKPIADAANGIVSILVLCGALIAGVWSTVDDQFITKFNNATGTTAYRQAVQDTLLAQTEINRQLLERVDQLERLIIEIGEITTVIDVDHLRSVVWENCPTDGKCRYTIRARLTEVGQHCGQAQVSRFVVDRFGVTHPVTAIHDDKPVDPAGGWTDLINEIILPEHIPPGVAEFYMERSYLGCFPDDPARKVRETTPRLIFEIESR